MMVKLVGILNVTPDSFSDGGMYFDHELAIKRARQLFADGASIVDVGAESTNPNSKPLSDAQEWERLEPVLQGLLTDFPGRISLDSYHPNTIKRAFQIGPVIVNDVTGLNNPEMLKTVIRLKPTVIISHLPGTNIQAAHRGTLIDNISIVREDLLAKARTLLLNGFNKEQIILDPGIGFGKTMELNRELLTFSEQVPEFKVMIGYSRKRFLGEHRMELEPNLEAGKVAIKHGAKYLRVHDVAGHKKLVSQLQQH